MPFSLLLHRATRSTKLRVSKGDSHRKVIDRLPNSLLPLRRNLFPIVKWLKPLFTSEPVQAFEAASSVSDEGQSGRVASDICGLYFSYRCHVLLLMIYLQLRKPFDR